jgi:hypothetical protein
MRVDTATSAAIEETLICTRNELRRSCILARRDPHEYLNAEFEVVPPRHRQLAVVKGPAGSPFDNISINLSIAKTQISTYLEDVARMNVENAIVQHEVSLGRQ